MLNKFKHLSNEFYDYAVENFPDLIASYIATTDDNEAINDLAHHEKPVIRHAVADSDKLTEISILSLLNDLSRPIIQKVVTNKNATQKVRDHILDMEIELPIFLSKNPSLTEEDARKAISKKLDNLAHAIRNPVMPESFLLHAVELFIPGADVNKASLQSMLGHPQCTANVLNKFLDHLIQFEYNRLEYFLRSFLTHKETDKKILSTLLAQEFSKKAATRGDILLEMKKRQFITKKEMLAIAKNIQLRDEML